jgi:type IV pilus assembly protein PilX
MISSRRPSFSGSPRHQRGLIASLLAIIVLVATLLAAIALIRSIDTSTTIAGSLSFRQGVIQEAARAYASAKNNINFSEPASDANVASTGYFSFLQPSATTSKGMPDILVSQATSATPVAGVYQMPMLATKNQVYYVVERLCPATGPADPAKCSVPGATITGGSVSNQTTDKGAPFNSGSNAAFRLSVLVLGPKNTLGYVQTVLR